MDLNEPFGIRPPRRPPKRLASAAVAALAAAGLVGGVLFFATADPHGGEPSAVTAIPPPAGKLDMAGSSVAPDTMPTGSLAAVDGAKPDAVGPNAPAMGGGSLEGGIKVFRGGSPSMSGARPAGGPLIINVTRALDDPYRKRPPVADAAPVAAGAALAEGGPRVAIFVGGMGLSETATRTATELMPSAVDLAFVPYGEKVQAGVDAAKAKGHEILLQIPMQTTQGTRPGPHTLRPDEPAQDVAADVGWLLGRFNGYAGVTNLLGAPVTANNGTMTTLLKAVGARGLFYLDDGTSRHSLAASLAPRLNVPAAQADVVIDATGDPATVRANLERLVVLARKNGHAIGMASGLPDHLAVIARFAADLGGRGVKLVALSAMTGHDAASVATAR